MLHPERGEGAIGIVAAILPETTIDLECLEALFLNELQDFRSGVEDHPVPAAQDLRAGTIAWIAVFAPEALGNDARKLLLQACDAARERPDFGEHGWYRTVYLDVAQCALSGNPDWLSVLVSKLDHPSSQLRASLYGPLGLVAPTLKLSMAELMQRIENNLRAAHFYNNSLMCLFCVLQANPAVKLAQVMRWREHIRLAPQDIATLDKLIALGPIPNALISDEFARIARYLLCRLLDPTIKKTASAPKGYPANGQESVLTLNALWRRIATHPLNASFISLGPKEP